MNSLIRILCVLLLAGCGADRLPADRKAYAEVIARSAPVTTENQYFQFIASAPRKQRRFAEAQGGLLRSDDGGHSYKFVIPPEQTLTISSYLTPANRPNVIVASGHDKRKGSPYLGWSWNGGDTWIDLSSLLPGYKDNASRVLAMTEDSQGRILLSVSDTERDRAQVVAVTLGLLY